MIVFSYSFFFFFNDTATTEIYTLSLHDAPSDLLRVAVRGSERERAHDLGGDCRHQQHPGDRKEHTSELQSPCKLVCRLLLAKKNKDTPVSKALLKSDIDAMEEHRQ